MLYHSHPLETEAVNVTLSTGLPVQRPITRRNHRSAFESPLNTSHPMEGMTYHSNTDQFDVIYRAGPMYAGAASDPYLAGIEVGRRLQLEQDSMHFSRYRSRLHAAQRRHDELVVSREKYCLRVAHLEKEIMTLRDRLMATQMSYGFVEDLEQETPVNLVPESGGYSSNTRNSSRDNDGLQRERERETSFKFYDDDEDFGLAQQLQFMDERDTVGGFSTIYVHESRYVEVRRGFHFCIF